MKTLETKIIEDVLYNSLFGANPSLAREYGTTEVTITSPGNAHKKEIIDFLSYNTKNDVFRCYEIKVSISDMHSKAKLSWHGNYNYLVIPEELYKSKPLVWWKNEVPNNVGIVVVNTQTKEKKTVKKSIKQELSSQTKDMLKNCLIRTLFYKNKR